MARKIERYANEAFKMHENRFKENYDNILVELEKFRKMIPRVERELAIKLEYGLDKIEPEYEYQRSQAWKDYMRDITKEAYADQIADAKKKLETLENSAKCEEARLFLISQKVPAWEGTYDNKRLLEEYAKMKSA